MSVPINNLGGSLEKRLQPRQNVMLYGPPFGGKTTFGLQFLASGLKMHECAILVTTNDTAEGVRRRAQLFGWDLQKYEDSGLLRLLDCYSKLLGIQCSDSSSVFRLGQSLLDLTKMSLIMSALLSDFCRMNKQVRALFDSVSSLLLYNDPERIVRFLHVLLGRLKAVNATSMLIVEAGMHDDKTTTALRSLCDGMIVLDRVEEGRYMEVVLGTEDVKRVPVRISDAGVQLAT